MGRGYWLPPNSEKLIACDGFYIDNNAVYESGIDNGWDKLLKDLVQKLSFKVPNLKECYMWKTCGVRQSRFVVLQNSYIDIIAEDIDDFVAVYIIIPEDCKKPYYAKRSFPKYLKYLQDTLTELYPEKIHKRINSQHTALVG